MVLDLIDFGSKECVILDVGANRGGFAGNILLHAPLATVHCFEPNQELYLELKNKATLFGRNLGKPRCHFDFNIAIHMRRGDVTINSWTERYTSSQCIQALINHLRFYFRKARPRFYIFSYSDDDLKILEDEDVRLFVDMNVFSVMDHLAYADCLVMAKSSMSYVAGMLNRGLVLYQPFWSVCLPQWFRADGFFV